jgi:hypothetical protein
MAYHVKSVIQECRQPAGRHLKNMWGADNLRERICERFGVPTTCGNEFVKNLASRQLFSPYTFSKWFLNGFVALVA